jgi:hypothetical protein
MFFGRLFENEAFSSSRAAASGLIWILALLATPGVMFSFVMSLHYTQLMQVARLNHLIEPSRLSHQALFVNAAMAAAVVVTALLWNSLTPDRRDVMVLGSLPVAPGRQARARLIAITVFISLFIIAIAGPTAVAFTMFSRGIRDILSAPLHVGGHIAASGLGAAFVFYALVNVQLLLAAAFGPRAVKFATLPIQIAAVAGVVAALGLGDVIVNAISAAFDGPIAPSLMWNPAAWFVGVYRYIGGDDRPVFAMLAQRAVIASAINILILLIVYPLAYQRCLRNVIINEGRPTTKLSRAWARLAAAVLRPVLRHPLQRGLAAFMLATIGRSHTHRFIIGIYAGIAFVLALPIAHRLLVPPTTDLQRLAWFVIPLGGIFWMVCGVRVALMMPVEPVANWLFKLTEPVDKRHVLTTVVTVMTAVCVMPLSTAFAGALLAMGETRLAFGVFAIVTPAGLCLIELLTLTMKTVPFSCTYLPGQLKLRIYWAPLFFLWLNFVFALGGWSVTALDSWQATASLAGLLMALWVLLRTWHMVRVRRITGFVYDAQEPAPLTIVSLRQA